MAASGEDLVKSYDVDAVWQILKNPENELFRLSSVVESYANDKQISVKERQLFKKELEGQVRVKMQREGDPRGSILDRGLRLFGFYNQEQNRPQAGLIEIRSTERDLGTIRVSLLGWRGIGKSKLLYRYIHGSYFDGFMSQPVPFIVGPQQCFKDNGVSITSSLCIYDVFDSLDQYTKLETYNANTHYIIVVDITDQSSVDNMKELFQHICQYYGNAVITIAATKCEPDNLKKYQSVKMQLEEYAKQNNIHVSYSSAKDGTGVKEVFADLMVEVIKKRYPGEFKKLTSANIKEKEVESPALKVILKSN